MATQLTAEDARQSLTDHVAVKGQEIFEKYGPEIGWKELQLILADRTVVRYPCEIIFDAAPLGPGELAHPLPKGETPEDGFNMCVRPSLLMRLPEVVYVVIYQLVLVNYGEFASADDAEVFGAAALGVTREDYYTTLCGLFDELGCQ